MQRNRLRELRTGRGLSQPRLADQLTPRPDPSTLSCWETGRGGIPDWRKQQLAEFFGVSVAFLMAWDGFSDDVSGEPAPPHKVEWAFDEVEVQRLRAGEWPA